jgi:hypothetical protein
MAPAWMLSGWLVTVASMPFHLRQILADGADQPFVEREAAGDHDLARLGADRLEQAREARGHGEVDALDDVGGGDAARNHVDHVGLGQHRADRRDHLGVVGLRAQRADLLLRDAEVAGDVFQELPRARGALAGHLVGQHLAAFVDQDRAAVQRAAVEDRAAFGVEIDGAAGMRGHRVEVPGMERDRLALAGGGAIVHVGAGQSRILQRLVIGGARELERVAVADPDESARDPFGPVALVAEDGDLDRRGADVDACGDRHAISPIMSSPTLPPSGRASAGAAIPWALRRANSAAPRAPV